MNMPSVLTGQMKRRTANSAVAEMPDALVLACASTANALPEQLADGWHVLSPNGEFPSPDGRYVQVFGRAQADAMVRSWNSIAGRFGRLMKNAVPRRTASMSPPIYYAPPGAKHPDLEPLREVSEVGMMSRRARRKRMARRFAGKQRGVGH